MSDSTTSATRAPDFQHEDFERLLWVDLQNTFRVDLQQAHVIYGSSQARLGELQTAMHHQAQTATSPGRRIIFPRAFTAERQSLEGCNNTSSSRSSASPPKSTTRNAAMRSSSGKVSTWCQFARFLLVYFVAWLVMTVVFVPVLVDQYGKWIGEDFVYVDPLLSAWEAPSDSFSGYMIRFFTYIGNTARLLQSPRSQYRSDTSAAVGSSRESSGHFHTWSFPSSNHQHGGKNPTAAPPNAEYSKHSAWLTMNHGAFKQSLPARVQGRPPPVVWLSRYHAEVVLVANATAGQLVSKRVDPVAV